MASYQGHQAGTSGRASGAGPDNSGSRLQDRTSGYVDSPRVTLSNGSRVNGGDLTSLEADLRVLTKLRRDIVSGRHPFYKAPKNASPLPRRPDNVSRHSGSSTISKNISINAERMSPELPTTQQQPRRAPSVPASTAAPASADETRRPSVRNQESRTNALSVSTLKRSNEDSHSQSHSDTKRPRINNAQDLSAPTSNPEPFSRENRPTERSHVRHPSLPDKPLEEIRSAYTRTDRQRDLPTDSSSALTRSTSRSSETRRDYVDTAAVPRRVEASTYRPRELGHTVTEDRRGYEPPSRDSRSEIRKPDKFEKQRLPPATKLSSSSTSSSAPTSSKAGELTLEKPLDTTVPRAAEQEPNRHRTVIRDLAGRKDDYATIGDKGAQYVDKKLPAERERDLDTRRRSPPPALRPYSPDYTKRHIPGPASHSDSFVQSSSRDEYSIARSRPISPAPPRLQATGPVARRVSPAPVSSRYDESARRTPHIAPTSTKTRDASPPPALRREEYVERRPLPSTARDHSPPRRSAPTYASRQEVPLSAPVTYERPARRDDRLDRVPAGDDRYSASVPRPREPTAASVRDRSPPRRSASGQNLQDRIFYGTELGVSDSPPSARAARDARVVSDARAVADARAGLQDKRSGPEGSVDVYGRPAGPSAQSDSLFDRLNRSTDTAPIPRIKTDREDPAFPKEARQVADERNARNAQDRQHHSSETRGREDHKGNYIGPRTASGHTAAPDLRDRISASTAPALDSSVQPKQLPQNTRQYEHYDGKSTRNPDRPALADRERNEVERLDRSRPATQTGEEGDRSYPRDRAQAYSPEISGGHAYPPRGASETRSTVTETRDIRPAYTDTRRPYTPPTLPRESVYPPHPASFPAPPLSYAASGYASGSSYPAAADTRYTSDTALNRSSGPIDDRAYRYDISRDRREDEARQYRPADTAYPADYRYGEEYYRESYETARYAQPATAYPSDVGYSYRANDPYAEHPPAYGRPDRSSKYYDFEGRSVVPAPYDIRDGRPLYSAPPVSTLAPAPRTIKGVYERQEEHRRPTEDYRRNDDRRR